MNTVSVVVPTHERTSVLQRAIDSVLNQTFTDIEAIVVDDASADCTEEVVNQYDDPRVKYIRHEENRGGSAARNTGIDAAEGKFIAFLDDDDEWRSDKLAAQLDAYERTTSDTGIVYTGIENVDMDGQTNSIKTPQIEGDVTKELLLHNFIGSFSAVMVDRETIEQTGLLDERFPSWQDWEYYIRLSQEAQFAAVPEPLVIRHNEAHEQISDDFETKLTKTYPLLRDRFDSLSAEYGRGFQRRREGHLLFHIGYAALSQSQYALARQLLSRSLLRDPTNKEAYIYWLSSLGGKYTYQPMQAVKRWVIRQFS
ncbi:glycosyltransferase [Halococcus dombrowskii]|uniref:Glycosyltransferase n=1 Tax=Halococcus dombrowskii TaxID=179637 RepID=A0AAX3AMK9_HALDO|nr:glycosyltransferase [Halococcus dombrowskii]UOO94991.1 glycosyltransferase [Halococcus dombrowskii]